LVAFFLGAAFAKTKQNKTKHETKRTTRSRAFGTLHLLGGSASGSLVGSLLLGVAHLVRIGNVIEGLLLRIGQTATNIKKTNKPKQHQQTPHPFHSSAIFLVMSPKANLGSDTWQKQKQ
jgi:hypothetical protein